MSSAIAYPILASIASGIVLGEIIDRRTNVAHDVRLLRQMTGLLKDLEQRANAQKCSVVEMFLDGADTVPDKECLRWAPNDRQKNSWTYREVDEST